MDFTEINRSAVELIEKIRDVSRSQKDLWQMVPFLALQANGRSGYSDQYMRAYQSGYWAVVSSLRDGYYHVFIDLETGDLVEWYGTVQKKAPDNSVLIIAVNINELDAAKIIDELRAKTKEPIHETYNAKDIIKRKNRMDSVLSEGNITPTSYRRIPRHN